jgi:hypothetical protein
MTIAALSECLGIPRRTLYRYRKDHPDQAPKRFDDLESSIEFIGKIKSYPSVRTKPRDQDRTESSEKIQNEEFAEYSPSAERRERIIKLRLANEAKRMVLEEVRLSTVTIAEWVENMDRIQAALVTSYLSCQQACVMNSQTESRSTFSRCRTRHSLRLWDD